MEILIKGGTACSIPNCYVFSDEDQITSGTFFEIMYYGHCPKKISGLAAIL
jgi:hypothetical protein